MNHAQIGGLGLSYGDYAGDVSLEFGESTFVRQIFNIHSIGGGPAGEIVPGSWTPVLPALTSLKFDYQSRYRELVLRIECDAAALSRRLLGQQIDNDLVFEETEVRNSAMWELRRRIFHFADDFNERGSSRRIAVTRRRILQSA